MRSALADLKNAIDAHPGEHKVLIYVPNNGEEAKVHTACCVTPSKQFLAAVGAIVGPDSVWTE
jgi:hypothetical protein